MGLQANVTYSDEEDDGSPIELTTVTNRKGKMSGADADSEKPKRKRKRNAGQSLTLFDQNSPDANKDQQPQELQPLTTTDPGYNPFDDDNENQKSEGPGTQAQQKTPDLFGQDKTFAETQKNLQALTDEIENDIDDDDSDEDF